VLLAALAAGVGLAILFAQLRPTFTSRDLLRKVTGVPVIGAISTAVHEGFLPWYRRQGVMVGGAVGLLVVVFLLNTVLTLPLRAALRAVAG